MAQVIWQPQALADLENVFDYLSEHIPETARSKINEIYESAGRLENFPLSGRIIPEIGLADKREIIHHQFRIMYKIVGDEVHITTVIHGARDFQPE